MTTLSNITLGSILREALEKQDIDALWYVVDELEGKHDEVA
jgi:hypothetical protein